MRGRGKGHRQRCVRRLRERGRRMERRRTRLCGCKGHVHGRDPQEQRRDHRQEPRPHRMERLRKSGRRTPERHYGRLQPAEIRRVREHGIHRQYRFRNQGFQP